MRKKTPEKTTTKPDWEKIALEYETGGDEVTLAALARKHGVPAGTVRNRAHQGEWADRREKYRDNLVTHARQKSAEAQAEHLVIKNEVLGSKWYQLAEAALNDALAAVKPSERQSQAITAGIATEKWRLVTGQTTAKSEQIIKGEYDDLTDEEAEALLAESVEILRYSQQNREAAVSGADAAPGEGG